MSAAEEKVCTSKWRSRHFQSYQRAAVGRGVAAAVAAAARRDWLPRSAAAAAAAVAAAAVAGDWGWPADWVRLRCRDRRHWRCWLAAAAAVVVAVVAERPGRPRPPPDSGRPAKRKKKKEKISTFEIPAHKKPPLVRSIALLSSFCIIAQI